jgi:ribosome-associated protein
MPENERNQESKTAAKKKALELQEIGAALLSFSPADLGRLGLPDDLAEALEQARRISSREGKRRQMQFVGSLMRRLEAETLAGVRDMLRERETGKRESAQAFALIESHRDRLVNEDPGALEDVLAQCPGADPEVIRSLVDQARRERERGGPPKAYRQLFRHLRGCLTGDPAAGSREPG